MWADNVFNQFIEARHWVDISLTELEIENWELEYGKKNGGFGVQAKPGNTEKKVLWQAVLIV